MNTLRTTYICILFAVARFGVSAATWDKAKGRIAKKLEPERYRRLSITPSAARQEGRRDA